MKRRDESRCWESRGRNGLRGAVPEQLLETPESGEDKIRLAPIELAFSALRDPSISLLCLDSSLPASLSHVGHARTP